MILALSMAFPWAMLLVFDLGLYVFRVLWFDVWPGVRPGVRPGLLDGDVDVDLVDAPELDTPGTPDAPGNTSEDTTGNENAFGDTGGGTATGSNTNTDTRSGDARNRLY